MKFKFTLALIFTLLLFSCDNAVYKEFYNFPDIQWDQSVTPSFDINIKETGQYDVVFTMRYIEGFQYKNMIGSILLSDLKNAPIVKKFNFTVIDDNKEYIGDVAGNMWDIEYTLFADTTLEAGKYTIQAEQLVHEKTLPFVSDIGIRIVPLEKK
jgi:gliding motility-associated lipoprotein GldH